MKKSRLLGVLSACVITAITTMSNAATISLLPESLSIQQGDDLVVDLWMDFLDEPTLGGGLDVNYNDTELDFISFIFDPTFLTLTDSAFTCPGAALCSPGIDQPNSVTNIAFGNFSGISGPSLVGTLTFNTLKEGDIALTTVSTVGSSGPFVSAITFQEQVVNFTGTSVNVTAVPLPGALYLMLGGIGLLYGYAKRHI